MQQDIVCSLHVMIVYKICNTCKLYYKALSIKEDSLKHAAWYNKLNRPY